MKFVSAIFVLFFFWFGRTFQKLLCIHMAEFRVTIEAVWQSDGSFEELVDAASRPRAPAPADDDDDKMEEAAAAADDDVDDDDDQDENGSDAE